ncbi:hypothetical protein PRIPAC_74835 [Pristionchus pacificus]|uniref:Uncharacterized protein n=1 Tax=Pristionchus pacificus TaxID=54126 RepID=A0A2A6C7Q1_PRIPA|nr:hypothetical protein PRIPAC_74835 [Pristionchus pacificus]|eukprot:PDM74235.1 hypothetical protein PRIPAC_41591 [Pristionchus pacificus]
MITEFRNSHSSVFDLRIPDQRPVIHLPKMTVATKQARVPDLETVGEQSAEKSDPRSFNSIVRLLVFSLSLAVPLPSARAATISVFAEMALLHKKAGVSFDNCRLDHRSLIGKAFATHRCSRSSAQRMSETIFAIVEAVRVVTKTGLATKKKDSEIAVPPVSPHRDFSTPTVVVVEDDDGATADIDAFDEDGNERVQAEKNSPPIS